MELDTGISKDQRKEVSKKLKEVLGTSYALYIKSQKFHWNVEGELFSDLHAKFEEVYEELSEFNDTVAERIRALGFKAPGSLSEFSSLSEIEDSREMDLDYKEMIKVLVKDYETLIKLMRDAEEIADDADDLATEDLISSYLHDFEMQAWMLRSSLK